MRKAIAALTVALLLLVPAAPGASASTTAVNVRIEGRTETLFEGPILTEGHNVRAAESDPGAPAAGRPCDGTNGDRNPTPGPTPTAASVDALSLLGESFDGQWYPGYDDYFVKRWAPDAQDVADDAYWGLLVNDVFTSVGGCQYQLDGGDEVVWVYDAFKAKPILALFPADYSGGSKRLTATATLNQPFEVEVDAYGDGGESTPPASPQRTGADPFEGAAVAPVTTAANGSERVDSASAATVTTGADGRASIVFDQPGWHRIKATVVGLGGDESAIRSNRIDVCVPDPPATGCGALPADDQVRTPPPLGEASEPEALGAAAPPSSSQSGAQSVAGGASQGGDRVRLRLPRLDRSRLDRGLVGVSWRVLDPGVGIRRWTISTRRLGAPHARFVTRASGARATAATLHLPPGAYRLQLTVTDVLGRSSSAAIGRVWVPR